MPSTKTGNAVGPANFQNSAVRTPSNASEPSTRVDDRLQDHKEKEQWQTDTLPKNPRETEQIDCVVPLVVNETSGSGDPHA